MNRTVAASLLAALVMGANPAFAKTTIGVTMSSFDDNFLTYLREAMANEAKAKGVDIQFEDGQKDVVKQISQVENFIAQKVDVMIVNPIDSAATRNITEKAMKAGIKLIYVNRLPEEKLPEGVVYVGSDENVSGKMQGEYLAKKLNGKGNVAIMMGELSTEAARTRTKGVKNVFAQYPDIKIVEEQTANWQRAEGMNLMSNWITTGKKIDAVASNNDEMAIGAIMALQQAGVAPGKVLVGGVDATPDALVEMKKGTMAVTVFQDAKGQGTSAIDTAVKMANGEKTEQFVMTPFQLVTPENYKDFMTK